MNNSFPLPARSHLFSILFLFVSLMQLIAADELVSDTAVVARLIREARSLELSSQYQQALNKLDSAEWQLQPALTDADSVFLAQIIHQRGNGHYRLRNYEAAKKNFEISRNIRYRKLGPNHEKMGDSWYVVGNVHFDLKEQDQATSAYLAALDIFIKQTRPDSNKIASAWFALGNIADEQENYDQAKSHFQQSLYYLNENNPQHWWQIGVTKYVFSSSCIHTGEFEKAIVLLDGSYEILNRSPERNRQILAAVLNGKSWVAQNQGNYEAALKNAQEGLALYQKIFGNQSPELTPFYINVGNSFSKKGDLNGAAESFQKGLDLSKQTDLPRDMENAASCYGSLATIFGILEDHEKALEYYRQALVLFYKLGEAQNSNVANTYMNIGIEYKNLGRYPEALENLEKANQVFLATTGPRTISLVKNWANVSNVLTGQGKLDAAIDTLQASMALLRDIIGNEDHDETARIQTDLAALYAKKGDYQTALSHFSAANTIYSKILGPNHPLVGFNLGLTFETLGKQNAFEKGEPLIQKSLDILAYSGTEPQKLGLIKNVPFAIEVLQMKAAFYKKWFQKTAHPDYLNTAAASYQEAMTALEWYRQTIQTPGSKIQLSDKFFGIYEGNIRTACQMKTAKDSLRAFEVVERSKTQILREAMQAAEATKMAGVPAEILAEEQNLNLEITSLELARFEMANGDQTSPWLDSLNLRLFDALHRQETFFERLEKDYPDYFKAKHDLKLASVQSIQSSLSADQTMLEYFVGDSSLYLFVINRDLFEIKEIKKDFPLEDWVQQVLEGLKIRGKDTTATAIKNGWQQYSLAAENLYRKLILPVTTQLKNKVVIVPDGVLAYLPFEVLLAKKPEPNTSRKNYPYWLRDKTISYALSANLFWANQKEPIGKAENPRTCLAMAPFSTSTQNEDIATRFGLQPLPNSGREVAGVKAILGNGFFALEQDATAAFFKEHAAQSNIILLSTHGKADRKVGNYSWLAFADRHFYVREVYALKTRADMVVLSACETATGQLRRGEGIIGMAYAFTYAGAKSVYATLWQVQDRAAYELSTGFFKNAFEQKQDKDAALRSAKLALVSNEATAHPYFWAPLVGFGEMRGN